MSTREDTRTADMVAFLYENHWEIGSSLRSTYERMTEAAKDAEANYRLGREDPAIKADQDKSIVTNNGWRDLATIFREQAADAERIRRELLDLMDEKE